MKRLAERAGWALVGALFVLFNVLLLANRVRELLWLTLASLLPIWVLTAVGGSLELAALLRTRTAKGGSHDDEKTGDPAAGGPGAGRAGRAARGGGDERG